jgi:hypothetical protein
VRGEEAVPCLFDAGCEGSYCAETGDDYSSHGISGPDRRLYYTGRIVCWFRLDGIAC